MRGDGIVKVLDFGLAKLTGPEPAEALEGEAPTRFHHKTKSGLVMGTTTYISPEQARGHLVDARTDIFSLGVVVYELLTGRRPFDGASIYETVAALLSVRPISARILLTIGLNRRRRSPVRVNISGQPLSQMWPRFSLSRLDADR